jgi:hypothetical protein
MSWFLRNSEVASEDDGTERRPPTFRVDGSSTVRADEPYTTCRETHERVESYREVDEDLSQRLLSRRRTERVTCAVDDDVPDALAHVTPTEGRPPLNPKVIETASPLLNTKRLVMPRALMAFRSRASPSTGVHERRLQAKKTPSTSRTSPRIERSSDRRNGHEGPDATSRGRALLDGKIRSAGARCSAWFLTRRHGGQAAD